MSLSTSALAGRILPQKAVDRLLPILNRVDDILTGDSDNAVSQRVAMVAYAIRVASAAIAYISQVLLARWMGSFEYGIFVGVWVAAVILGGVACLGFQTASIRFISEYQETKQDDKLRGAIIGSMSYSFISATILAVLGCTFLYFFEDTVTDYYVIPFYLAAICLPMLSLHEVQDGVARAYNWPMTALAPTFLVRPLLILLTMGIAILLGFDADAATAMFATIVATYIATLGQFASLYTKLRKVVPRGRATYLPKEWLLVALPIFLVEGFYNLLTNTDILFVSHYMEPEKVGVYFAAVKTLALVHFVYFAVKAAAAHRFSAYRSSGNRELYESYINTTVKWIFWPSLLLALAMMGFGKYFLMLFGEEFLEGQSLLWILALGIIIRSSVGPAESVLTMSGEQRICAGVYGAAFLINVFLNMSLIPEHGLYGAAWATTLALTFESFALYAAAKRRLGLHIFILPDFSKPSSSNKDG